MLDVQCFMWLRQLTISHSRRIRLNIPSVSVSYIVREERSAEPDRGVAPASEPQNGSGPRGGEGKRKGKKYRESEHCSCNEIEAGMTN